MSNSELVYKKINSEDFKDYRDCDRYWEKKVRLAIFFDANAAISRISFGIGIQFFSVKGKRGSWIRGCLDVL